MQLTIHGSGYVGLVSAACFADAGIDVLCVDIDRVRVDRLARGDIPFHEPGLPELVKRNLAAGRLRFTTDTAAGLSFSPIQMIAVGTPRDDDGAADVQSVLEVAADIGAHMTDYRLVVTKSTVPVGTTDRVAATIVEALTERGIAVEFGVAANPEFLREGAAIDDFRQPDRIVIGVDDEAAAERLRELYAPFIAPATQWLRMDRCSAELTKYAANAMLATRISFMNELAGLAESVGADIEQIRLGIGADPRIGADYLQAGAGYGGSCLPKDVSALRVMANEAGVRADLMAAVKRVNDRQQQVLFNKLVRHYGDDLTGRRIAVWGLAFKPGTDDLREAPSQPLIEACLEAGARVQAYDPVAGQAAAELYAGCAGLQLCERAEHALMAADALVLVTAWPEFAAPDWDGIAGLMATLVIVDGRNLYDPAELHALGYIYYGVGRGA